MTSHFTAVGQMLIFQLLPPRPETANRTLAEIDELYQLRVPKRKWRSFKTTSAIVLDA